MDTGLLIVGALLLMGGKRAAAATKTTTTTNTKSVGASLLARANSARAKSWIPIFKALDQSDYQADAYSRWAGIESSGDPLAVSPLGERGLFQCMPATALGANRKGGAMTLKDWDATQRVTTTRTEHARIALMLAGTMWNRAKKLIRNVPTDPASRIWYSKMWHSRPADFNGQVMHGNALDMARHLAVMWAGKPNAMYRLMVANVIAYGTPTP